jgi:uncharacterized membrane protein
MERVYGLTGMLLFGFAWFTATDRSNPRRFASACFWLLLGVLFALGPVLPNWVNGLLVVLMVLIDAFGGVGAGKAADTLRTTLVGNRIFLPVLAIPLSTIVLGVGFRIAGADATRGALLGLGLGGLTAAVVAMWITKSNWRSAIKAGKALNETMGAVNILPQLLASLGVIFASAKCGELIAEAIRSVVPAGDLFLLVLANCAGMAIFTILVGNSFAAFPVIAAGVLVPLLVRPFHLDPAMAGILTLTAGSSGTLMTLMAANFNVAPAALLQIKDAWGIVKFQLPVAVFLLSMHVLLLYVFARWS